MINEGYVSVPHEKPYRYEEDGLTVTRGSAWSGPGCHDGCGVLMYTDDDGKLVRVEGDPDNPYNKGRLCVRCLAVTEAVENEGRIKYPMRRVGERGENRWERISWDEAYDEIERKFKYYRDTFGAESVTFWKGTGRDIAPYMTRLAWSFGSPNCAAGINGVACYAPRVFGCISTSGSFWVGDYSQQFADRYQNPNWKAPERIVIWGNNPIVSNSDGLFGAWIPDCMKLGSKLIVIDPRCTWLASRAEYWLQIRPGTDAALAMGILNILISEDLYDREFVDHWCYGFDELAERVADFTPARTAEITWIPEEQIVAAAHAIAESDGCAMQWGLAVDQTKEAMPASQAIFSIIAITGNIERPGGMIKPPELLMYLGGWGMEFLSEEQSRKRLGVDEYPFYDVGLTSAVTPKVIEAMETGKPYPLKAAWIQTSDLLTGTIPDPERVRKAMDNLEFIVMVDLFMNATAVSLADIVLPACTYPERDGIRIGDGCQRGETINQAVPPVGEAKSDMEICLELGRRFNAEAWPWENVDEMYTHIFEPTGLTFDEMRKEAPVYLPYEYYKYKTGKLRPDGQVGFNTRTGRVELWSTFFANCNLDPLPRFYEPEPSPYSTPDLYEEYPLILTTGARRWNNFHSENRRQPHLRAIHPEPTLEIHPETAKKFGVSDGEWVWVEGPRGRAKRIIETTPTIDPRVVSTTHGWSHPEAGAENMFDVPELNINNLISIYDISQTSGVGANYKTMLCRIYKVNDCDGAEGVTNDD